MMGEPTRPRGLRLSGKLLGLTFLFVMLAEVLIFVPSVANFRTTWLTERVAAAHIASLAARAAPDGRLPPMLRDDLLLTAQVRVIAIRQNDKRKLILSVPMPGAAVGPFDLRLSTPWGKIADAVETLFAPGGRNIRVIGVSGFGEGAVMDIVLFETPLRQAMIRFGLNVLGLSIVISLITAALIYFALNGLLVRPMQRLTENMVRFALNPEDQSRIIKPSRRSDELGVAELELARMQRELSQALHQKTRLASLGLAVSKINHDLRNMLGNAQLISDRLGAIDDPTVQRLTPKLIASIDRAIRLATETLNFGKAEEAPPQRRVFPLRPLVEEVGSGLGLPRPGSIDFAVKIAGDLQVDADPDQLFRVFTNLFRNAVQVLDSGGQPAKDHCITVAAESDEESVIILVRDTGPGVPQKAKDKLFVPFQGAARKGGTGLGLAIVAEIVHAHGGEIALVDEDVGASFRLAIPNVGSPTAPALEHHTQDAQAAE